MERFLVDFAAPLAALGFDLGEVLAAIRIFLPAAFEMWSRKSLRKCKILALEAPKERRKMSDNARRSLEDGREAGICCNARK